MQSYTSNEIFKYFLPIFTAISSYEISFDGVTGTSAYSNKKSKYFFKQRSKSKEKILKLFRLTKIVTLSSSSEDDVSKMLSKSWYETARSSSRINLGQKFFAAGSLSDSSLRIVITSCDCTGTAVGTVATVAVGSITLSSYFKKEVGC